MLDHSLTQIRHGFIYLAIIVLSGCATANKVQNQPISSVEADQGYRFYSNERPLPGSHMVGLAFSGGGTRAAALSYGVMQELRDTYIDTDQGPRRVLDEVDTISGVSGGSFTAAYYGLFGDKLFEDYENVFLRRSIQVELVRRLLNPIHWVRSAFSGFDRTEMAVDFYNRTVFQGKTFADLSLREGPFIDINATELHSGRRFSFTQSMFDGVCSRLEDYPVARAVTASSAVPILFPSIVIKNHGPDCHSPEYRRKTNANEQQTITPYPYLHLVDGGISDNLGLLAIIDRIELIGGIASSLERMAVAQKDVLVILVNAAVSGDSPIGQSLKKPSSTDTLNAVTDMQMRMRSEETRRMMQQQLESYQATMESKGTRMQFYYVEIAFEAIQESRHRDYFNRLPTSLSLENDQIDGLITAGRILLRDHPDFQAFLKANNGKLKQ